MTNVMTIQHSDGLQTVNETRDSFKLVRTSTGSAAASAQTMSVRRPSASLRLVRLIASGFAATALLACTARKETKLGRADLTATPKIEATSLAFAEGQSIPVKYTCDGENVSPPLKWTGVPDSSRSLALVCDDPDAPGGPWVHWVLYNLAATVSELIERSPATEAISSGAKQGKNDFGRIGYGGPCPPQGPAHHYYFRLYALDAELALKPGATRQELDAAMRGHILAEGTLIGIYART